VLQEIVSADQWRRVQLGRRQLKQLATSIQIPGAGPARMSICFVQLEQFLDLVRNQ
jgi:hypothetical protein